MNNPVRLILENSIERSVNNIPDGPSREKRSDGAIFETSKQSGLLSCLIYSQDLVEPFVISLELSSDTDSLAINDTVHVKYLRTMGEEKELSFDDPVKDLRLSRLAHLAFELSGISRQVREPIVPEFMKR